MHLLRVFALLPPVGIASSTIYIFVTFTSVILRLLSDEHGQLSAAITAAAVVIVALTTKGSVMTLWALFASVATSPGQVPSEYMERHSDALRHFQSFHTHASTGTAPLGHLPDFGPHGPRYCRKCTCLKPPRTHHCSICGHCVLAFDHHCPMIANCVGYRNRKAFLLLLIYGTVTLTIGLVFWAPLAFGWWQPLQPADDPVQRRALAVAGERFEPSEPVYEVLSRDVLSSPAQQLAELVYRSAISSLHKPFTLDGSGPVVVGAFICAVSLWVSLLLFMSLHGYLAITGQTTIEMHFGRGANPYCQGSALANLRTIFGNDNKWFLPLPSASADRLTRGGTEFRPLSFAAGDSDDSDEDTRLLRV